MQLDIIFDCDNSHNTCIDQKQTHQHKNDIIDIRQKVQLFVNKFNRIERKR